MFWLRVLSSSIWYDTTHIPGIHYTSNESVWYEHNWHALETYTHTLDYRNCRGYFRLNTVLLPHCHLYPAACILYTVQSTRMPLLSKLKYDTRTPLASRHSSQIKLYDTSYHIIYLVYNSSTAAAAYCFCRGPNLDRQQGTTQGTLPRVVGTGTQI